jgi:hypothetical protein
LPRNGRKTRKPRPGEKNDAHRFTRTQADDRPGTLAPTRDRPHKEPSDIEEQLPDQEQDLPIDVIDIEEDIQEERTVVIEHPIAGRMVIIWSPRWTDLRRP